MTNLTAELLHYSDRYYLASLDTQEDKKSAIDALCRAANEFRTIFATTEWKRIKVETVGRSRHSATADWQRLFHDYEGSFPNDRADGS